MSEPVAYLSGRFVPLSQAQIGCWDSGFVFGATVTDFCRTVRGQLFDFSAHAQRLCRDAHSIGIPFTETSQDLSEIATSLLNQNGLLSRKDSDSFEWAIITFATPGPISFYTAHLENRPISRPTLGMHCFPLPFDRYCPILQHGADLVAIGPIEPFGEIPGGLINPMVKHRSRLHWWLADQKLRTLPERLPHSLAILQTTTGHLTETAIATVAFVIDQTLTIPPSNMILDGIMLQHVRSLAQECGIPICERPIHAEECRNRVQEALLVGTAFGIAGVSRLLGTPLPHPGPITTRLMRAWTDRIGLDMRQQILDAAPRS
ncbi:aminotransferase class IV [Tuwongella immobilis]|uniref:branched-chain-amino-acid transaminase n=1 Tax=Tuwongella immobilis TaxID=692036 RepID=A0A6C2YK12_9BACT|nr:aminotransferase class IV [Tuwongella immobilis]VIP01569.1 branched-chain amino acid aminotransferase : Aminotransferase class IV OS=Pirellula staleyi (strain ATCC 27377 / DSM 6068 / ICPB 4128) GN=Psta_1544 PE=3 SV=1: Aminotran_4 [Tuwongella immobilis]VTR98798.1 branched-chain amino acid aminotransferase : Aminotransferase class IV OS=Pirellula staleyi (strain ATCC 27377 / DSM 6068 / ICPB 4128) GN=Psta_1544 PE=3 SV=1: Aminotran_4 [Tuwongella immobilis]